MSDEMVFGGNPPTDLLKIARAVGGDTWFKERIDTAAFFAGVEPSKEVHMHVAKECVAGIRLSGADNLKVDTQEVTDAMIVDALTAYAAEAAGTAPGGE